MLCKAEPNNKHHVEALKYSTEKKVDTSLKENLILEQQIKFQKLNRKITNLILKI